MSGPVYGQDERVGKFVAKGLHDVDGLEDFGKFVSIGIEKDGDIVAGAVYNNV